MHIPVFKGTVLGGAVGLSLLVWQGWQQTLVIEVDPRLDAAVLHGVIATPPVHQELSIAHVPALFGGSRLIPPARLLLSLDQPAKNYSAAIHRQTYVQVVGLFQNLMPPIPVKEDGSLIVSEVQKLYAADPLVFSLYRQGCPGLILLPNEQEVLDRLAKEKDAIGIINTNTVTPILRTLTPPMPVRLWIGWQASASKVLSALGMNLRLYGNVAQLLASTRIQQKPRLTTMVAVGDIMLGRRIGDAINKASRREPLYPFTHTTNILRDADVAIGNLECAVAAGGSPQPKKEYTFRAEPKVAKRLKAAGFDIVTLANNHSLDYGAEAFQETLTHLHKAGIETVGGGKDYPAAQVLKVVSLKDGTRVGFLGYTLILPKGFAATSTQPGVNWMDDNRFKKQIQRARGRSDVVIVQFHWGKEYYIHPDAIQRYYGRLAIDYGADLVIGHHPHWIQEMEFYKGKFIAYSLGNFVFDMNHRPKVREGLMLKCLFKDKSLYQVELDPVLIQRGQPEVIPWKSQQKRGREAILKEVLTASRML